MSGNAFASYPTAGRDYSYYGSAPVKRQRTSIDYGNRSMYDADGRMRQMEAYPQATAMYSNQPGSYGAPMMPYSAGHTGVPDYAVRQPQPVPTPTSFDSPTSGTVTSSELGYPGYTAGLHGAQMSYGIPSAQVSPMQDPAGHSRTSQQATMQSLGMANPTGTPVRTTSILNSHGQMADDR